MRHFLTGIFYAAAAFTGLATAASDCDNGPWQDVSMTGFNGGSDWCETKWKAGMVIKGVEVWSDRDVVSGVRFYYSNGEVSAIHGKMLSGNVEEDKYKKLEWDPAVDRITSLTTWGNFGRKSVGRIEILTAKGGKLSVGKDVSNQNAYSHKVHTGIILAAFGKSGWHVDLIGFTFLKGKQAKVEITDVKFEKSVEQLNKERVGISPYALDIQEFSNDLDEPIQEEFGKEWKEKNRFEVTTTNTNSWGVSASFGVSAGVPMFSVTSNFGMEYSQSKTETTVKSNEDETNLSWKKTITLPPKSKMFCRASVYKGDFKGKFTSKVNVYTDANPKSPAITYNSSGEMHTTKWSKTKSECQKTQFKDKMPALTRRKRAVAFVA